MVSFQLAWNLNGSDTKKVQRTVYICPIKVQNLSQYHAVEKHYQCRPFTWPICKVTLYSIHTLYSKNKTNFQHWLQIRRCCCSVADITWLILAQFIVISKDMSACLWKAGKISFIQNDLLGKLIFTSKTKQNTSSWLLHILFFPIILVVLSILCFLCEGLVFRRVSDIIPVIPLQRHTISQVVYSNKPHFVSISLTPGVDH